MRKVMGAAVAVMGGLLWACASASEAEPAPRIDESAAATEVGDGGTTGSRYCTFIEGSCGPAQAAYGCEVGDAGTHPIERTNDGKTRVLDGCSVTESTATRTSYCCPSACIEYDVHWREALPYPYDAADVFPSCEPKHPRMILCPAASNGLSAVPTGCKAYNSRAGSPYAALCCE